MSFWTHNPLSSVPRKRRRGLFDLSDGVGPEARNRPDDVIKVESLLAESGDYDPTPTDGPTGYFGRNLRAGIERYQSRTGLRMDGLLNPDGATISTLRGQLQTRLAGRRAPTPDEVEAHHRRRAQGLDSPLMPRLAAAPVRRGSPGGGLQDKGDAGEAEFRDFLGQLGKRDPGRAASLGRNILGELADEHSRRLAEDDDKRPGSGADLGVAGFDEARARKLAKLGDAEIDGFSDLSDKRIFGRARRA